MAPIVSRVLFALFIGVSGIVASLGAQAHDTPIALLKIHERSNGLYNVEWVFSSAFNQAPPTPVFPDHCQYQYPNLNCGTEGLIGELKLLQLGEQYSAAVVQISYQAKKSQSYTLTGASPSVLLTADGKLPWTAIGKSYIPLGFEHILLGVDHLLFVLGLMLLVTNTWTLVKTITSFTIAHSITLAAATLGWVMVPERSVNAVIALSIVFIAVEIIHQRRGQKSLSARLPWIIAFGFGLLHGFGFAGALSNIGLPEESLPLALLFFNVGVEIGQLCFVFVVLTLYACHRRLHAELPQWSQTGAVYGMGAIASFWFISRTAILLAAI